MKNATTYTPDTIANLRGQALRDAFKALTGRATTSKNAAWLREQCLQHLGRSSRKSPAPRAVHHGAAEPMLVSTLALQVGVRATALQQLMNLAGGNGYKVGESDRLPAVGSVLVGEHAGVEHRVLITAQGFQYPATADGDVVPKIYQDLQTISTRICGHYMHGFAFFNVPTKAARRYDEAAPLVNLLHAAGLPVEQLPATMAEARTDAEASVARVQAAASVLQQIVDALTGATKEIARSADSVAAGGTSSAQHQLAVH